MLPSPSPRWVERRYWLPHSVKGAVAELIRSDLHACRIRVIDVASEQVDRAAVSSIAVLRGTAERSVVSIDAGTAEVTDVPDLSSVLVGADVVLIDGHHPVLAEAASQTAKAHRYRL
jgi:hypothetical protein